MFIPVRLNNKLLNLEIDSGAAVSCILQSILEHACPYYRDVLKAIKARELYDVQNNILDQEDDRLIPLELIGFGHL